jgi:four helix bundle protein
LFWDEKQIVLVLRAQPGTRTRIGAPMTDPIFDHDRLDVYRLSIKYVARSFVLAKDLSGVHRHARDQWLRAAQSIPLNIAEGNGKRSLKDRNRFFDIARGSALECASIQDVLAVCDGIDAESHRDGKQQLKRLVSMLTKLIARSENTAEPATQYQAGVDYEYEYRCAEYEHEGCVEPELSRAPEPGLWSFSNGQSTFPAR